MYHSARLTGFLCLALLLAGSAAQASAPPAAPADQPAANTTWNLGDLYPTPQAWTEAYDRTKGEAETLDRYKGSLGQSAAALRSALDAISNVRRSLYRLHTYASLKADEDVGVAENQERKQLAGALATLLDEKTAWVAPELLAVGADRVRAFQAQDRDLAQRFNFLLDNTLRAAPHTLTLDGERVLAAAGDVLRQPNDIYDQLATSELPFPTVTLSDGTVVRLDQTAYTRYRQAANRNDRKLVFDVFWSRWENFDGTNGAILTTNVMSHVFTAKTRRYPNSLAQALFPDNMPESVYRTLVAQANAGLPTLHRYFRLRKRLLGIEGELEYYDIYPSMFGLAQPPKFNLIDSERITLAALRPYGEEYLGLLRKGFAGS